MASGISGQKIRINHYGITVARAAGNLAQTGNLTLFNIAGGRIILTGFIGAVTTVIQAQADAIKFTSVSSVGSIATDLCATVDVNGAAVGNILGITGTPANAAVLGSSVPVPSPRLVLPVGLIRMNAAASNTGQMSFVLTYIPLDDGATVTAA